VEVAGEPAGNFLFDWFVIFEQQVVVCAQNTLNGELSFLLSVPMQALSLGHSHDFIDYAGEHVVGVLGLAQQGRDDSADGGIDAVAFLTFVGHGGKCSVDVDRSIVEDEAVPIRARIAFAHAPGVGLPNDGIKRCWQRRNCADLVSLRQGRGASVGPVDGTVVAHRPWAHNPAAVAPDIDTGG
jgi:hypothetical protein